jgi:hypothetical protein
MRNDHVCSKYRILIESVSWKVEYVHANEFCRIKGNCLLENEHVLVKNSFYAAVITTGRHLMHEISTSYLEQVDQRVKNVLGRCTILHFNFER